jgi:hypothetical protein
MASVNSSWLLEVQIGVVNSSWLLEVQIGVVNSSWLLEVQIGDVMLQLGTQFKYSLIALQLKCLYFFVTTGFVTETAKVLYKMELSITVISIISLQKKK